MTREPEIKDAAISSLNLGLGGSYDYRPIEKWKGNHGIDLPLWLDTTYAGSLLVGMVECKKPIDPRQGGTYNSARKVVYTGVGQLMFHGRAIHRDLPVALFIGASHYDAENHKPILTRARTPDGDALEPILRERLTKLEIDLIVCARVGMDYVVDGHQAFLERVRAHSKRARRRK